jgi:hypothetical protein
MKSDVGSTLSYMSATDQWSQSGADWDQKAPATKSIQIETIETLHKITTLSSKEIV